MGRLRLFAAKTARWLNSQCCFFTLLSCFSAATIHCYVRFVYELQGSPCWAQLAGHRLQCVGWWTDRRAHNGGQLGPTVHCMPTMPLAFANNLMLLCWKIVHCTGCSCKTGGQTSWWSLPVTKPTNGRHEMLCVWASIVISLSLLCSNSHLSAPATSLIVFWWFLSSALLHLHCYGYPVHLSRCLLEQPN